MKHFPETLAGTCDDTMWLLVFLLETAFFYAVFTHPVMVYEVAQFNWVLVTLPVFLPALALAMYGIPFKTAPTR